MKRTIICIAIYMAMFGAAMASNADTAQVEHTSLRRLTVLETLRNPALHGVAYTTSLSELSLGIDTERQTEAFVPEKGDGFTLPYIKVKTHIRLDSRQTVWGEASYTTGKRKHAVWNSTGDYELLQPYVLADTLGGDTRRERYYIGGGYSHRLNRWLLGAEMQVRAEQEYRTRDPRMRAIITDLNIRLGGGYKLDNYTLALAFEGNIYKQTNSVDFYSDEGVIPEYQMTGLGTEYSRFSGDKRRLYYNGGGAALQFNLTPNNSAGIFATITADEHRYHRRLADYNSMPLTDLYRHHIGGTFGWTTANDSRHKLAIWTSADYTRRTGNEHIGGTSDARYFPVIGKLTMYKSNTLDAHIGALYGRGVWHAALRAGYIANGEKYVYPQRRLDADHAYIDARGQAFFRPRGKFLLTAEAHAGHMFRTADKLVMPFANMDTKFVHLINHKYDYARANYTRFGGKLRADVPWRNSRIGVFAQIGAALTLCSTGERATNVHAALGITF